MKTRNSILAAALLASVSCFAQFEDNMPEDTSAIIGESMIPSIGAGAGVLTFNGDIGKGLNVSTYSYIRAGYHVTVEERFHPMIGVQLNGLFGKLAQSERSTDPLSNRNFESKIMQFGLSGVFYFDNDKILKRRSAIKPYISAGFSYLKFDPYGDLTDKDGVAYQYWTDGSIRNVQETPTNEFCAGCITTRDYTYETQLKDSLNNYQRSTFVVPISIGTAIRLNDNFSIKIGTTYNITFSDYLDNEKKGGNDGYLYSHVSVVFGFPPVTASGERYKDVDFKSIDDADTDGDGVKDIYDRCMSTPKDVKVTNKGCPIDTDEDGVPDYLDKEPGTAKGATVDENGVTQTAEMMAKKAEEDAKASASGTVMPKEFKFADKNKDGAISYDEVTGAIDALFEGDANVSVETLYKLIEYFFDQ